MKDSWIDIIKRKAEEVIEEYSHPEEPIRDDIFKILRSKGVLIFYPLRDEKDLDGFHVDRVMDGRITPFVYINSANYIDKCIFCAAHELGHINAIENDIIKEYPDEKINDEQCDGIMNRFAAELLMPESKIKKEIGNFIESITKNNKKLDDITDQDIVKLLIRLMDYFFVPYKSVVKRLYEVGFLTKRGKEHYIEYDAAVIELFISEGNYIRPRQITELRQMDNLEDIVRKTQKRTSVSEMRIKQLCVDFGIVLSDDAEQYIDNSANVKLTTEFIDIGGVN